MRALIRRFDGWLRRVEGVFEFTDDPHGLLRLQVAPAPHPLSFSAQVVRRGEPVLLLHLWNEHIPPLPPGGPDVAWAAHGQRLFVRSMRAVAQLIRDDPRLAGVRAVGGATAVLSGDSHAGGERLMRRLGFVVMPYHRPLGRFGEFWENFYTWWIMWTFNAASLRRRQLIRLRRAEIWMPADEFLRRYAVDRADEQHAAAPALSP